MGIEEKADDGEPFDDKMKRLTSELSEMFKKSHELEEEIRKKLEAIGYEIFDILNDMLLGKITIYQKEILIEKLKLVEKFLNT